MSNIAGGFQENPFALLGLPLQFDVNSDVLEANYIAAQKQAHPDFLQASALVRQASNHLASQLNQAYATLKHPLKRAEFLLKYYQKWPIPPGDTDFLEEMMALQEQASSLSSCTSCLESQQFEKQLQFQYQQALNALSTAFSQKKFEAAQDAFHRLSYLQRIQETLDDLAL